MLHHVASSTVVNLLLYKVDILAPAQPCFVHHMKLLSCGIQTPGPHGKLPATFIIWTGLPLHVSFPLEKFYTR
jgi:hypothetical protein